MSKSNIALWDKVAANNTDTTGISLAESVMRPPAVNNAFRDFMAQGAMFYADLGGVNTVAGTANAVTITSAETFTALATGLVIAFKAGFANTTAATVNVDALGVKAIRRQGDTALSASDILANGKYLLVYDAAYNTAAGAWVLVNPSVSVSASTSFTDSTFFITDDGDATKKLAFQASTITTGTTRTLTAQDASGTIALLDVASQTITGGAIVTSNAVGTVSSGTTTLNPGTRPLWDYTNGGAHTLAPGTNRGTIVLDITNNGSAGAITTSGWTKVTGAFDTTNAHVFRCMCSIGAGGSLLQIQAMF